MTTSMQVPDAARESIAGSGFATVSEAAALLRISRAKLYEMLGSELSYCQFGRSRRIPWRELIRYTEENSHLAGAGK